MFNTYGKKPFKFTLTYCLRVYIIIFVTVSNK